MMKQKILPFLVNFYAAERIVLDDTEFSDDNDQQPQQLDHPIIITDNDDTNVVANHATKPRSKILMLVSSPFTQTDINLIFVFYVVSILLLLSIIWNDQTDGSDRINIDGN